MVIVLLLALAAMFAVPRTIATRSAAVSAAESSCTLPGITVVTDPANDQDPTIGDASQDLLSVSIAEPNDAVADRLYVTMKVRGPVNPTALAPNTTWRTHFMHDGITWFVTVYSDQSSNVAFEYGQIDPTTGSNSTLGTADGGVVTPDGTFRVIVSKSLVGSPAVGTTLTEIRGTIQRLVGAAGTGLLATVDRGPDDSLLGDATYGSPYTVAGSASCPAPTPTPTPSASATPTPSGTIIAPRYYNYAADPGLGDTAGEPSIGFNPNSHRAMYVSNLQTLRVTFPEQIGDPGTTPEAAPVKWEDVSGITTNKRSLDPILYTDQRTGRTFVSQLNTVTQTAPVYPGLNSLMAYSDDDGATWTPAQINPPDGSNDHQTVGAGPYPAALSTLSNSVNKGSAVYYCAQGGYVLAITGVAYCSRSDDGGLNFGKSVPIYADAAGVNGAQCSQAIHGHVKVAPDGTVYVPNAQCGGKQAVAVSTDAGTTWTVRTVTGSVIPSGILDPSIAISKDSPVAPAVSNTMYFAFVGPVPGGSSTDNHAFVAVTKDRGLTWSTPVDIGASVGVKNAVFPAAVAGDSDRAAVAFLGTATGGNHQDANFKGTWYGYIATTYDGGQTWTTVKATTAGPVQREACIWNGGGANRCRNLLDFTDATVDDQGHVLFAYADGCIDGCETGNAPNSYSAKASIARQSGGRGLYAQFDTPEPAKPKRAWLTGHRDDMASYLTWLPPDNGGAAITGYNIYRGTAPGNEVLVGTATADARGWNDRSGDVAVASYTYKVTAINSQGESSPSNTVALTVGSRIEPTGACEQPGVTAVVDPAGDASDTLAQHDITSVSMAEPENLAGKLVFTLKVKSLSSVPPGWRWAVRFGAPQTPPDVTGLGPQEDWFVSMVSSDGAAPTFTYGSTGVPTVTLPPPGGPETTTRVFTTIGNLDPASKANADGTITLILPKSAIGNPQPGQFITNMLGSVRATVPSALPGTGGTNETIPDTTGPGTYQLRSATLCQPNTPPIAILSADVTSGDAPLTVTFDGIGSYDPDSIDTIASYAFNFGDGTDDVVQSSPTITHTFTQAREYAVKLVVTDSRGKLSSNTARMIIEAEGAQPTPTPTPTPTATPTPTVTPTPTPTPTVSPTPTPTPGQSPPAATFNHNTLTDFSAVSGEPFIRIDKQDNVFVSSPFGFSTTVSLIWKSIDGGRTFIPLGTPIVRDGVIGPGGGDTHQDFDDKNRLYYSDLSAGCVTVAVSEDAGNTFSPTQNNTLTCIGSGEDLTGVTDDRQWIAAFGDGIAYMTVRNLAVSSGGNFHLSKTTDAGRTWHAQIIGSVTQSGPLEVDKQLRKVTVNGAQKDAILLYQLYYSGGTLKIFRITDFNDGTPFIIDDLTVGTPGGSVATVFPVMSIDKGGNLYVVWSDGSKISMATSTNRGQTWTAPIRVSPTAMTGMNIMPWIVAGDPGRVDIVWYHSPGSNDANSVWDVHMAQSLDALSVNPAFAVNKVNENPIHTGEICLDGLDCDLSTLQGEPRDRSFAEFPSIDIDSHGAAYMTYNDSHNQLPAPYVMVAKQIGGASLFASVGTLGQSAGTVTVSQPAANATIRTDSLTFSGTQTLTPLNFDRDDAGDARFPDHGATIGSNIPALDIKSVSLKDNANSVTVNMQVADSTTAALAAAPALSGGDGVLYLTQFHSGDKVYWVAAEVRAGQARYLTGGLGAISSATAKKYITYDPDLVNSMSVQGQITNTAPGTISMTIPRTLIGSPMNGTTFTSVTGYSFSERGALLPMTSGTANPSSLPVKVDASGATTYVVGQGAPQLNGGVEISLDDPNFGSPRTASIADALNDTHWSLTLSGSDLVPGAHTAYIRQHINGRDPSPAVTLPFTIAATIEGQVNSLVNLVTSNAKSSLGVTSFDLGVKNISSQTIFAPLHTDVASLTSASGTVTVANADSGGTGVGASWDYSTKLSSDNALIANELSALRNVRFNNPRNEAFSVTFNVIGNLARGSTTNGSTSSGGTQTSGSTSSTTSTTDPSAITALVFKLTYNPLLNSVTVQLITP